MLTPYTFAPSPRKSSRRSRYAHASGVHPRAPGIRSHSFGVGVSGRPVCGYTNTTRVPRASESLTDRPAVERNATDGRRAPARWSQAPSTMGTGGVGGDHGGGRAG